VIDSRSPSHRQKMEPVVSRLEPGKKFREHPTQLRRDWSALDLTLAVYDLASIDATGACNDRPHPCTGKLCSDREGKRDVTE